MDTDVVRLKNALFDDQKFTAWSDEFDDLLDAWVELMEFKWSITDQLRGNEVAKQLDDEWVRRATGLVVRVKARIAEVQRILRADGRHQEYLDLAVDMREARAD